MKKWQVLALALLLALAGGLKVLRQRQASGQAELPPVHVLPTGQLLPESTAQYYVPEEFLSVPPRSGAPSSYGALPTIKNEIYDRGLCKGGSLNEILSAHGRVWGYEARHAAFSGEETDEVYARLARYLACVGLARRAPDYCDYLPGQSSGGDLRVGRFESPNYGCLQNYTEVSFAAYAAGRDKSEASCRLLLAGPEFSQGRQVSASDFCAAASRGAENLCASASPPLSRGELEGCRRLLPAAEGDCAGDEDCLRRLGLYRAMKAGSAAACPESVSGLCSAFLSGKEAACSVLLVKLGGAYCGYLEKAQKKAGGFAGYSPAETAEAIRLQAEQRAAAEKQAAEAKRLAAETAARARRMLGRERD